MPRRYEEVHSRSLSDPEPFWAEAAEAIHWERRWDQVLDVSRPPFARWFGGGMVNTCYNAVDRHADGGRGDQTAIIYDSPVTETKATLSYRELKELVARFAGVLRSLGVGKGDRVLIYMPNMPEAVIGMLACARLGAAWCGRPGRARCTTWTKAGPGGRRSGSCLRPGESCAR